LRAYSDFRHALGEAIGGAITLIRGKNCAERLVLRKKKGVITGGTFQRQRNHYFTYGSKNSSGTKAGPKGNFGEPEIKRHRPFLGGPEKGKSWQGSCGGTGKRICPKANP